MKKTLAAVLLVSQALVGVAHASVTWFSDPGVLSVTSEILFDSLAPLGTGTNNSYPASLFPTGITASSVDNAFSISIAPPTPDQEILVFDKQFGGFSYIYGNNADGPTFLSGYKSSDTQQTLTTSFAAKTVLGFYYGSTLNEPNSVVVTLSDGSQITLQNSSTPSSTLKFIGFASTLGITSATFAQTNASSPAVFDVTRVVTGLAAPVPELSAYAMFGAGLALFGMIGRRRSRKQ